MVAAFDFDVTITVKDMFVPFLYRSFGRSRVSAAFLRLTPEAVKVGLGLSSRDRFKGKIVAALFLGESLARLRQEGLKHARHIESLLRPSAFLKCMFLWGNAYD